MTYKMAFMTYDGHTRNLPNNKKYLTLIIKEDYSSKSSSDDNIKLLTKKFKKIITYKTKNKNKFKKK